MGEVCTDGRFKIIAAYKKRLMEATNIETSPDEMKVVDRILFRFWQMKWLPPMPHGRLIDADALIADNGIKEIQEYLEVVEAAPTIIPASKEGGV